MGRNGSATANMCSRLSPRSASRRPCAMRMSRPGLKRLYTDYDYQLTSNFLYNLADPAIGVHREYHSKSIRPGTVFVNGTGWSSPRTDELMDLATIEPDPAKRNALYHEFQKLVVEGASILWSHELTFPTVYNKKYHDLIISPLGIY